MKVFMAALLTETNSFSPIPTGRASFMEGRAFYRDDGSRREPGMGNIPLIVWRRMGEADGHVIAESICASAQPAGTTLKHIYEELRDMLLADLRAAMPVDVVLLNLHGAMIAHDYDDCEGDILAKVREVAGAKAVIGAELDLHCHLTEEMRVSADAIVIYKEYPHIDIGERAAELYRLCVDAASGKTRPVMAYHDCRMVSMWRTPEPVMRRFVDRMADLENRDGILSVSFGHGFPWGDVEEVGAKMLVIADGDEAKAQALARELGGEIWRLREETSTRHDGIDEAIDKALAGSGKPVVIADVADNAGGGAPSDNTNILRRLVERGVGGAVTGCYWDPQAVAFCAEAGEGATFLLRIGGKCGPSSGDPIDLMVTVRKLAEKHGQSGLSGGYAAFGPSAWVAADGIDIVLVSDRRQTFSPDAFTGLGIRLDDKRLIVVKSTQHFQVGFAPLARDIRYVSAGGAIPPEYAEIPYTKRVKPFWPRVADPFEGTNLE